MFFFLLAKVGATISWATLGSLFAFFVTELSGLALYALIVLPLFLKFVAGVDPFRHFKAMGPALLTAFSTSSSAASLPVVFDCLEKRAGLSNRVASFSLPLGTSLNLSGTALHLTVALFFIASIYGVHLTLTLQLLLILMALVTSFGMAGIPSGSILGLLSILPLLGLPLEGVGLLFAVERILDMFRTVTNVLSNSCCAVMVARLEQEKTVLA